MINDYNVDTNYYYYYYYYWMQCKYKIEWLLSAM